jgi:hypothetical protein
MIFAVMALQYKTKAGRLTNLTDARYFNALGVDWLGFNMDVLDEHSVSLKDLQEIRQWLFEPKIVVEAGLHQDKTELIYLTNEIFAEAVEVPIEHPLLEEDHFLYPVFVSMGFGDLQRTRTRKRLKGFPGIEAIILKEGGKDFSWQDFKKNKARGARNKIRSLKEHFTVLIDLPFHPDWFLDAIETLEVSGVHISGDIEEKPGLSKVDEYDALLSQIEVEG